MRTKVRLMLTTMLVALLVGAATVSPTLAQTPKRGGVFRVPVPDAPSLDPHQGGAFVTQIYASLVYNQLVRFPSGPEAQGPGDHRILPDLAEKWSSPRRRPSSSRCARARASTASRRSTGAW